MKWGLLSTARINDQIIAAAAESDRATIVAVASRDATRAKDYARTKGIPRSYGAYEALLDDPDVDAVYISLPNAMHHSWSLRALAAGKHVLCEKPYSRYASEAEEGFAAARAHGRVLMEAFMYRHHPQMQRIVELVRGGSIGPLRVVLSSFTFFLSDLADVRLRPDLDGGALMDLGCYCVSGARSVAGDPTEVFGEQVTGPSGTDISFHATMRHERDVISQFDASFTTPRRQRLEIVGEEGVLTADAPWRIDWGGTLTLSRDDTTRVIPVPVANPYRLELENMADAVVGTAPPLLGRADALGQARTIEALYESAVARRALAVDRSKGRHADP